MTRPRILLIEDEAMVAMMMEDLLTDLGCDVAATFGEIGAALSWLEESHEPLDGAVLDVNLGGETVFLVADVLVSRGTPFGFVTGYTAIPQAKAFNAPVLHKPLDPAHLGQLLASFERQASA